MLKDFFVEGKNPLKDMRDHVKTCVPCQHFLKAGDWQSKEDLQSWIDKFFTFSKDDQEEMLAVMAGFYKDMRAMFKSA